MAVHDVSDVHLQLVDGSTHRKSTLVRLREIGAIMAKHGFAPAMRRMPVVRALIPEGKDAPSKRPAAERFACMLEDLGPTFVKLGQILSTRGDLLPGDFIVALSRLQDQVPPFPFAQVRSQVERGLGRSLEACFSHFDETPLASASMAQVHAATTLDGHEVVVKVQRPGIVEQVKADAEILRLVAQLLELVVEEFRRYHATELLTEFQEALADELDFSTEARNLRAFQKKNAGRAGIHIPTFYAALSSKTVLTMERIRGRRISELVGSDHAPAIIERLVAVAFEHVYVDGLFHGDPHPGNILITDEFDIAFIDFGLVGRVAREAQDRMLMLLLALHLRDADTLARIVLRLGESDARIELSPFRAQIGRLLDRYMGLTLSEVKSSQVFSDLVELSSRFGVRLPREFAILSKATLSIEGIVRQLHPDFDPSKHVTARAEELLLERVDPRNWKTGGLRSALQMGLLVQEVPLQLGQALLDLERGHIQVTIKSEDLAGLQNSIRGLAMTIFGAILAGVCLLGGFFVLIRADFPMVGAPILAAGAFTIAGGCFGVAFAWYLTGGKLPRIGIRRLLRRFRVDRGQR